jgi:tRNA nucleotidyltransferase (CCA-adding enzyme)
MDIKAEVLKKIKPSQVEAERIKHFVSQLQSVAKTVSGLDAVIVGSIGKFTWLAGDHDVDIFLMFDANVPREELERLGLEYGKRIVDELGGKCNIKYAEHPYVHATIKGYDVDVVPCYRIRHGEKIKSAVDRSPLHLQYVIDTMKKEMADEVRLLKQFCKGTGVYGSDAKHQGFSGYICELLVLNYGTFDAAIEAAGHWRAPFTINIERHLGISSRFKDQPLVIIDPIDPERNVASVVNCENFVKFVAECRRFKKKPSLDFFFPAPKKPLTAAQISQLTKRGTAFLALPFKRPDVIDDVLYPQLRRAAARIAHILEHEEFHVIRALEFGDDPVMIFELEVSALPNIRRMIGPPIFEEKHSMEFLSKYAKPFTFVSDGKWMADVDRKFVTAEGLLNSFLKATPENLVEAGIPSHVAAAVSKKRMILGRAFWSLVRKNKRLSCHMAEKYFVDYSGDFLGN